MTDLAADVVETDPLGDARQRLHGGGSVLEVSNLVHELRQTEAGGRTRERSLQGEGRE